jgi:hypothetical protein
MLAIDNFLITEFADALAEALIEFSPLILPPIPGNGMAFFVQTSAMVFSSLILSDRRGDNVGTCADDMCDWERTTVGDACGFPEVGMLLLELFLEIL